MCELTNRHSRKSAATALWWSSLVFLISIYSRPFPLVVCFELSILRRAPPWTNPGHTRGITNPFWPREVSGSPRQRRKLDSPAATVDKDGCTDKKKSRHFPWGLGLFVLCPGGRLGLRHKHNQTRPTYSFHTNIKTIYDFFYIWNNIILSIQISLYQRAATGLHHLEA